MNEKQITIIHENEELLADVLFTHVNEDSLKQYVVFQVVGSEEISAARYIQTDDKGGYFEDIETDEEWDEIENLLDDYYDLIGADEEVED